MFRWSYPEAKSTRGWEIRHRDKKKKTPGTPDHECMQDTDQEQPTVQLETSDDCIPIHERKCKHIIASAYSHKYMWKSQISKVLSRLVGHECRDRETDGAIHWEVILSKIVITFLRDGSREFTDRDWINYIWKGSSKTRFKICQNLAKIYCTSEPFNVTQEEK